MINFLIQNLAVSQKFTGMPRRGVKRKQKIKGRQYQMIGYYGYQNVL